MTEQWEAPQPAPVQVNVTQAQPADGLAVASLVLGILWLGGLGSVLAVIFGHVSLHRQRPGRGMAIAGLVLGWIGVGVLALTALFLTLALIGAASGTGTG